VVHGELLHATTAADRPGAVSVLSPGAEDRGLLAILRAGHYVDVSGAAEHANRLAQANY
jgi:hypothetical protein